MIVSHLSSSQDINSLSKSKQCLALKNIPTSVEVLINKYNTKTIRLGVDDTCVAAGCSGCGIVKRSLGNSGNITYSLLLTYSSHEGSRYLNGATEKSGAKLKTNKNIWSTNYIDTNNANFNNTAAKYRDITGTAKFTDIDGYYWTDYSALDGLFIDGQAIEGGARLMTSY